MKMRGFWIIAVLAVAGEGCQTSNPNYCPDNPHQNCLDPIPDPGERTCNSNADCPDDGVCDVAGARTCVVCTDNDSHACSGTSPVCKAQQCAKCDGNADCSASAVCLTSGACASEPEVAYAALEGKDDADCSMNAPCRTIAVALAKNRPYIKLTGMFDEAVAIHRNVTIVADAGATLSRTTGGGSALKIDGTSEVEIDGLTISNVNDDKSATIIIDDSASVTLLRTTLSNNRADGIRLNGGSLQITQSKLSDNGGIAVVQTAGQLTMQRNTVSGNTKGGLSLSGMFDVTNTVITGNGFGKSNFGGVTVAGPEATVRLEFNTISGNSSTVNVASGVQCAPGANTPMFRNNIVFGNPVTGAQAEVSEAGCTWAFSDLGVYTGPKMDSKLGNLSIDPGFVNPGSDQYGLASGSQVADKASPDATVADDIVGTQRPQGGAPDMGAYEMKDAASQAARSSTLH